MTLDQPPGGNTPADASGSTAFPDPFPAYPTKPYTSKRPPPPPKPPEPDDEDDPPTDPTMSAVSNPYSAGYRTFDPFAADAYRPTARWYRTPRALAALAAIVLAVGAVLLAAVLLLTGVWTVGGGSGPDSSTTPSLQPITPTTTPGTSPPPAPPPPPEPPPPPPPEAPAANPQQTYWPPQPRSPQGTRRNVTTPETRPPDISVRPTHRPAFPGQPGER